MNMKIVENDEISQKFRALPELSKGAERLLRTFATSEAPLLHPQPFRSTRGASNERLQTKAPMFCVIHENW